MKKTAKEFIGSVAVEVGHIILADKWKNRLRLVCQKYGQLILQFGLKHEKKVSCSCGRPVSSHYFNLAKMCGACYLNEPENEDEGENYKE